MDTPHDEKLWKMALRRASFKKHLFTYIAVNIFFWALWLLKFEAGNSHPWPLYPMLGWGIGVAFDYYKAYHGTQDTLAEKEYEKLIEEKRRKAQQQ